MARIEPCRGPLALLALALALGGVSDAMAQFSPPPQQQPSTQLVPPMPIPNVPEQPAPPPPMVLPEPAPPPPAPPQATPRPRSGESTLQVVARFGREAPVITGGLHWRVYPDKPDQGGVFRLIKEDRTAQPSFALPAGTYVVHVTFGLASAAKTVQLRGDALREVFEIPAGALTLKGQVGDVRIPTGQIAFDIYPGSQFESSDQQQRPIASGVITGETVILPEGSYYIVSKYGDGNAVVRSDIRVQIGKLTDVTVTHRAAAIMLKLVSQRGGEALANTDWAVLSPAGDVVTESRGAFPRVILAEGEYKVIARNDNKVYQQDLKVITGVDGEIEVLAR